MPRIATTCDRCCKPIQDTQIQIQLIRYGYKGPEMNLCNSCYRSYQVWFNAKTKTSPVAIEYIR